MGQESEISRSGPASTSWRHPNGGRLVRIAQGQERPLLASDGDPSVQVHGGIRLAMGVGSRDAPDWC